MTILHMDAGREMRGGQWQALLLMEALARRGHTQRLLAPDGSPLLEQARSKGLQAEALRRWARLPAADVIHAHDALAHTVAALWKGRAPLVVSRRVAFPVGRGLFSRWKYKRAARYIAVSRYVARELAHAGVPEDRIAVVFDGVRLPDLKTAGEQRAQFRARLDLPPDAFVAGTITSLHEKPILPLLDAAEALPQLHLLIGTPNALAKPMGARNVWILRPDADLSPFLFALDAFVYLSESEGLGSAAVLAMAHALPVIASTAGGLPEIVRPDETGLPVRNVAEEVGAALEKLFANRSAAAAMGRAGRRWAEAEASDDIMAQRTEQVYLRAVRGG